MRTRVPWKFAANPFVVMTDITIALAFVMFGYYLANANAYREQLRQAMRRGEIERDKKQIQVAVQIAEAVRDALPGYTYVDQRMRPEDVEAEAKGGRPEVESLICAVVRQDGSTFLKIERNETFMRLRFLGLPFHPGTTKFAHPLAEQIYAVCADPIRSLLPGIAYLYVHGVAAKTEGRSREDRVQLSERRANVVFRLLKQEGLIDERESGPVSPADQQEGHLYRGQTLTFTSYGPKGRAILVRYAIPYGTGDRLYPGEHGRVDLILFFRTPKMEGIEQ